MSSWRLLPIDIQDGFTNMAIDEAILEARSENVVPNTLRFFRWKPSTATIGRNQSLSTEIHMDAAKNLNVDVVRRISGGGAVYHDFHNEITYSVIAAESDLRKIFKGLLQKSGDSDNKIFDVNSSYNVIIRGLMSGLNKIGLKVEQGVIHCPVMLINERKISGNAQARRKNIILQHGTILLHVDADLMYSILKAPIGVSKTRMVRSVRAKVAGLYDREEIIPLDDKEFQKLVVKGFEESLNINCVTGCLTERELQLMEKFRDTRYKDKKWLNKFP